MEQLSIKAFLTMSIVGFMFSGGESPKAVAISADNMNVLYIGLDNPISVAVSEVADKDVIVEIADGTITKTGEPGKYICKVQRVQGSRTTISVFVKKPDGTKEKVGYKEYRIREVPDLELLYGTLSGSAYTKAVLLAQTRINASLGAGFAFEGYNYNVMSYKVSLISAEGDTLFGAVQGNSVEEIANVLYENLSIKKLIISDVVAESATSQVVTIKNNLEIEIR